MTRIIFFFAAMCAAAVSGAQTSASPSDNPVVRVVPRGNDGASQYYTVKCKDKVTASVVVDTDTDETCAHPRGKTSICKVSWPLQHASRTACTG